MRRKGVRRVVVAVALAAVMVVGRAAPAGAFLSSLDPAGWAVVAQMAAIISQAIAIKRQVENVRNQARAEFFGKLAPLTGKLSIVSGWLRNARSKAGVGVYNPQSYAALLPTTTLPVFNRPMEACVGGGMTGVPCMPPIESTAVPASTIGPLATGVRGNVLSSASQSSLVRAYGANDAELGRTVDRLEARARENITRQRAAAERAENKRAVARAIVEEQMGIVEDWRGCQAAPAGAWNPPAPTVDDRLPCMTNDGLGRNDPGGGTQGAQSDLVAKLDALERYQDGDVSKVQLDTLQTQLIVMLGRLEAARVERDAMELAEEQELRMAAEAKRRREIALLEQHTNCQTLFGPSSYFIENIPSQIPPTGTCRQVTDVTAAAIAAAAASCLRDGLCAP